MFQLQLEKNTCVSEKSVKENIAGEVSGNEKEKVYMFMTF